MILAELGALTDSFTELLAKVGLRFTFLPLLPSFTKDKLISLIVTGKLQE